MKNTTQKNQRKNLHRPANRIVSTVRDNPYSSLAALATIATLGLGAAFLRTNGRQPSDAAGRSPSLPSPSLSPENSYFEAAPRSISGSHRLQLPAAAQSGMTVKKGGGLIIGSAAVLTSLYLLGRRM